MLACAQRWQQLDLCEPSARNDDDDNYNDYAGPPIFKGMFNGSFFKNGIASAEPAERPSSFSSIYSPRNVNNLEEKKLVPSLVLNDAILGLRCPPRLMHLLFSSLSTPLLLSLSFFAYIGQTNSLINILVGIGSLDSACFLKKKRRLAQ